MYQIRNQTTRRIALVSVSLLLVLAMLAVLLPQQLTGAVALAATCSTNYTVQSGDTLSSIGLKYNVTVAELAAANDLKEPYQIFVGQSLCIPASANATPVATGTATATGPGFKIDAGSDPYTVVITTAKLAKKTSYLVSLNRTGTRYTSKIKLGTMKTDKNGVATRTFRIPNKYRNSESLTICLKNAWTDDVVCNSFIP
jgi:spore germination protein YaaH